MEGIGTSAALSAGAVLLPIAYNLGTGCFNRMRSATQIRKNVICVPSRSGKSTLAKSLVSNKNILLIDLEGVLLPCDTVRLSIDIIY
jgi:hypothetical protein